MRLLLGARVDQRLRRDAAQSPYGLRRQLAASCASGTAPVALLEVNWLTPRKVRELTVLGELRPLRARLSGADAGVLRSEPSRHHGPPPAGRRWPRSWRRARRHRRCRSSRASPGARAERLRRGAARRHAAAGQRRRRAGGARGMRRTYRVGRRRAVRSSLRACRHEGRRRRPGQNRPAAGGAVRRKGRHGHRLRRQPTRSSTR